MSELNSVEHDLAEGVLRVWLDMAQIEEARCERCKQMFSYRRRNPPQPRFCVQCVRGDG
jgi:hypothetical protein